MLPHAQQTTSWQTTSWPFSLSSCLAAQLISYTQECIINVRKQHESVFSGPWGAQLEPPVRWRAGCTTAVLGRKLQPVSVGRPQFKTRIDFWKQHGDPWQPQCKTSSIRLLHLCHSPPQTRWAKWLELPDSTAQNRLDTFHSVDRHALLNRYGSLLRQKRISTCAPKR